jgi:hypothetical protein
VVVRKLKIKDGVEIMCDLRETYAGYVVGDKTMEFYSAESKWIRKIQKWAEKFPDEVIIHKINKDGSILAQLPISYMKIAPKNKRILTDEQRIAISERLSKSRVKNIQDISNYNMEGLDGGANDS